MKIPGSALILLTALIGCGGEVHSPNAGRVIAERIRRSMNEGKKPNRLIREKSPYLLQHAFNPVDWYPWGEPAFEKARSENKPIFLSIGYSTCHWCHVMERESFESDSIAGILNDLFVCIKVDREERPDVDQVYMAALQAMGQNGGWPLTMFLTPDRKPFYGGTYFPPDARFGRPGLPDVLRRIHEVWRSEREKAVGSAEAITTFLQNHTVKSVEGFSPDRSVLDACYDQLARSYDPRFGGFGGAPKFPRPVTLSFLFRYAKKTGNQDPVDMATHTLRKMTLGGLYDHVGGGFHRYSVDGEWRVPHFEKMLYDQAQLVMSFVDLYQISHDDNDASIIRDVLRYVMRDMTAPDGGFYSAEDADSGTPGNSGEKSEGAFYLWTLQDIHSLLGDDDGRVFAHYYGVEENGNALHDAQNEFAGKNILYVAHSVKNTATTFSLSPDDVRSILARCRVKLMAVRRDRPRPHLDDKILTSWNGLMISACARAYQALQDPAWLHAAQRAVDFIERHLVDREARRLLRSYRDGEARYEGHLADYSFLVAGLLDLYEAGLDVHHLEWAIALTEQQVELFWDSTDHGFFDSSGNDPSILVRMKEQYDGAEPAGNSVAAMNLLRLAQMTDDHRWRTMAEQTIASAGVVLRQHASAAPLMVAAIDVLLSTTKQVIIAGNRNDPRTWSLLEAVHKRYLPNKIVLLAESGEAGRRLASILPFVSSLTEVKGKPTAYVCEEYTCQLPANDRSTLEQLLK
jgi:uncharacterized protein YyaL (SSP411 family)